MAFARINDVDDPTDFPEDSKAPGLRALESSLRCPICGDLFEAPVIVYCGHCFCSNCIREALQAKQECPQCRASTSDVHIRPNPAMEDAVEAWRKSRPGLLELIRESALLPTSQIIEPTSKKRKLSSPASSSPPPSSSIIVSSSSKEKDVLCPLCSESVAMDFINTHIDSNCAVMSGRPPMKASISDDVERRSKSKAQWSKLMGSAGGASKRKGKERAPEDEDEYIPTVTYHTMKDKQLRDALSQYQLITTGDRNAMIARHTKWTTLHNANMDRSHKLRKTPQELRRELATWEARMSRPKKSKPSFDDVAAYQRQHRSEFAALTEQARPKKQPSSARESSQSSIATPTSSQISVETVK